MTIRFGPTRLAAAIVAAAAAAALAGEENLVANGGFEKGMDGWTLNDETASMKVAVESREKAEGRSAAHVTKPSSKGLANDRLQLAVTRVPAGRPVVVSAKLKGKALENTFLKFFVFDADGEVVVEDCDMGRFTGTFDWRDATRRFELPKEAVRAELRLCMFRGGECWLDDVRVVGDSSAAKPPAAPAKDAVRPLPPDFVKWLDANAVRIRSLDAGAPFDDLAPLEETLKDVRIVQLGESVHGDGAAYEAKARLVRFLHERLGFEVLAFESGLFECDRANELLRKGDAEGALRGSVFGVWNAAPVRSLFRRMADAAKSPAPLLLAGFDCRRSGRLAAGFLDDLAEFLTPAGRPAADDLAALKRLEAAMDEQGDDYAPSQADLDAGLAAHARIRKLLDDGSETLIAKRGEAETAFFSRALDNWRANEAFERSKSVRTKGEWHSTALRDTQMAANLKWLAETRYPGKKIVTWGATFHLAHGLGGVKLKSRPRMYDDCVNMGQGTHETFGAKCYTIGFAAFGGETGSFGKRVPLPKPRPESVEDLLHRYGSPLLFVDLRRDGPFAKPLRMSPMSYARDMEASWPDVLDAVVFIDEMTPAK